MPGGAGQRDGVDRDCLSYFLRPPLTFLLAGRSFLVAIVFSRLSVRMDATYRAPFLPPLTLLLAGRSFLVAMVSSRLCVRMDAS